MKQLKKVILIPDSFKGTMSSLEVCGRMKDAILRFFPEAEVISVPVADGGEGTVEAFLSAVGGEKVDVTVAGPFMEEIPSFYGILPDGTAVVEMAAAAGLPMVGNNKNPELATTFGVGQLIGHAVGRGCKKIILGLGGSATNDGGTGAAAALGARFTDKSGNSFVPTGGTLKDIAAIDLTDIKKTLEGVEITAMCDIDNPLCGPTGAAAVFGPQKGADADMVQRLDSGLLHMASLVTWEPDIAHMPGAGAAGGMGAGMVAFCGARLRMGIEAVLDTVRFDTLLETADLVLTGEGKIDTQSLRGKVVMGVAARAKLQNVPVIAVVGDIGGDIDAAYGRGVTAVFSINRVALPYEQVRERAKDDLFETVCSIMRVIALN